jgi:hypothetical protein
MTAIGIALGLCIITLGMVCCTDRIDQWHRRHKTKRMQPAMPPFITSHTQCKDCGTDGDLLNINRQCINCFHLQHQRTATHG